MVATLFGVVLLMLSLLMQPQAPELVRGQQSTCTYTLTFVLFVVLIVKHFSEAFLLTYYTFITPEELITKLLYR